MLTLLRENPRVLAYDSLDNKIGSKNSVFIYLNQKYKEPIIKNFFLEGNNLNQENNLDNGYISVNGTPTDCVHLAWSDWSSIPTQHFAMSVQCESSYSNKLQLLSLEHIFIVLYLMYEKKIFSS